jgi:hypothetical protein
LDPARIADVYVKKADGAGEKSRNAGRTAAPPAGLPTSDRQQLSPSYTGGLGWASAATLGAALP